MRFLIFRLSSLCILVAALLLGIENIGSLSRPMRLRLGFPGTEALATSEIPSVVFCLAFFILGMVAAILWTGGSRHRGRDGETAP